MAKRTAKTSVDPFQIPPMPVTERLEAVSYWLRHGIGEMFSAASAWKRPGDPSTPDAVIESLRGHLVAMSMIHAIRFARIVDKYCDGLHGYFTVGYFEICKVTRTLEIPNPWDPDFDDWPNLHDPAIRWFRTRLWKFHRAIELPAASGSFYASGELDDAEIIKLFDTEVHRAKLDSWAEEVLADYEEGLKGLKLLAMECVQSVLHYRTPTPPAEPMDPDSPAYGLRTSSPLPIPPGAKRAPPLSLAEIARRIYPNIGKMEVNKASATGRRLIDSGDMPYETCGGKFIVEAKWFDEK